MSRNSKGQLLGSEKSVVYNFFESIIQESGKLKMQCILCKTFNISLHINRMRNHIINECSMNSVVAPHLAKFFDEVKVELLNPVRKNKKRKVEFSAPNVHQHVQNTNSAKSTELGPIFRHFPYRTPSEKEAQLIEEKLFDFVVANGLSEELVDDYYFKRFIKYLSPFCPEIASEYFRDFVVPRNMLKHKHLINNEIEKCRFVSICLDDWTDCSNESYCTSTLVTEKQKTYVLNSLLSSGSTHDAAYYKKHILFLLHVEPIKSSSIKVVSVCTDGAKAITNGRNAACKEANVYSVRCMAHLLNLMVVHIAKRGMRETISMGSRIVLFYKKSNKAFKLLSPSPVIQTSCDTRWTSLYCMLNSILKNKQGLIEQMSNRRQLNINVPSEVVNIIQNSDFWSKVEVFTNLLQPFMFVSKQMQQNMCSCSDIFALLICLFLKIRDEIYCSNEMKTILKEVFNQRIKEVVEVEDGIFVLAYFLDPHYKGMFLQQSLWLNCLKTAFFNACRKSHVKTKELAEGGWTEFCIGLKEKSNVSTINEHPFDYWNTEFTPKNNHQQILKEVSKQIFCIISHSAEVERVFSLAGIIKTDARNRLRPAKVMNYCQVKHNLRQNEPKKEKLQSEKKGYVYKSNDVLELVAHDSNFEFDESNEDEQEQSSNDFCFLTDPVTYNFANVFGKLLSLMKSMNFQESCNNPETKTESQEELFDSKSNPTW